jgi:hypothetical protein
MMNNPKSKTKMLNAPPDGTYYAKWSGYTIRLILPDWEDVNIEMDQGIRGVNHKCVVVVRDGFFEITDY